LISKERCVQDKKEIEIAPDLLVESISLSEAFAK
jgi:hypothetical protein